MKLDYQKELTPVLYGKSAVKIIGNTVKTENQLCFSMHWHERMELLLVTDGILSVHIGSNEIKAHSGSLVIIPPERPHMGISGIGGVSYDTIMFDLTEFYNSANITANYLMPIVEKTCDFINLTDNDKIISAAQSLLEEHSQNRPGSSLVVVSKIYELLGFLYRYCICEAPTVPPDNRLKNVMEFIGKNFRKNITSSSLCKHFGYDEAYFCRRFKTVTGLTPMMYIQILRLEEAKRQIKNSHLKIYEIAENCGFSDPNYFSRCFKRHFGITPTEYERKNR